MKRNNRRRIRADRWRRLHRQMKIVVVFAGQRLRRHVEPIQFKREPVPPRLPWSADRPVLPAACRNITSEPSNREPKSRLAPSLEGVGIGDYNAFTVTGPFTVDSRITGAPSPYSIRRLSLSSNVLRALAQTLA